MKGISKSALLMIGVVVLLVIGVGTALAAGGNRGGGFGNGQQAGMHNGGNGVMAAGAMMDAAAGYIGISETALMTERHDGKSLAEIATEHGKPVAGLEAALVAAFKTNLDAAVKADRLTETQAAQALSSFKAQVGTMVERTTTGPLGGRGAGMMAGNGHCARWP